MVLSATLSILYCILPTGIGSQSQVYRVTRLLRTAVGFTAENPEDTGPLVLNKVVPEASAAFSGITTMD